MGDIGIDDDPYQILGLEGGPELTEAEIKKAYRKLALAKHPGASHVSGMVIKFHFMRMSSSPRFPSLYANPAMQYLGASSPCCRQEPGQPPCRRRFCSATEGL